jgi:hypothetical protein
LGSIRNDSSPREDHTPRQFNTSQLSGARTRAPLEIKNEAELYKVSSLALKHGKTVYTDRNAYRTYKKVTHKQVDELLVAYYNAK